MKAKYAEMKKRAGLLQDIAVLHSKIESIGKVIVVTQNPKKVMALLRLRLAMSRQLKQKIYRLDY